MVSEAATIGRTIRTALSDDEYARLRKVAIDRRETLTAIATALLRDYLQLHDPKGEGEK